jgi:SAM-dependent methyltransferase
MSLTTEQTAIDRKNAAFWDELCGSGLARSLGITERTPESIRKFDEAYLAIYPYLTPYVCSEPLSGKKVLEIGLGYGTLGRLLLSRGCQYHGLDIAEGPVAMLRYSLEPAHPGTGHKVQQGSALAIPYTDALFDYVYTIGTLHHTGDLEKAVSEVYRVLAPGGKAVVMLYNRHSFRQLVDVPLLRLRTLLSGTLRGFKAKVRGLYDANEQGSPAPHTDYVSPAEARKLFKDFSSVKIDIHNFDTYTFIKGRITLRRDWLLNNIGRVLGLDLYITAKK